MIHPPIVQAKYEEDVEENDVLPGKMRTFAMQMQMIVRFHRFEMSEECARAFRLMCVIAVPHPITRHSISSGFPLASATSFDPGTRAPGDMIFVTVKNTTDKPQNFKAVFRGTTLQ